MCLGGEDAGRPLVARARLEGEESAGRSGNQVGDFGGDCNVDCFELWHAEADTVPTWMSPFSVPDVVVQSNELLGRSSRISITRIRLGTGWLNFSA